MTATRLPLTESRFLSSAIHLLLVANGPQNHSFETPLEESPKSAVTEPFLSRHQVLPPNPSYSPVLGLVAVDVVVPVADPELLVERGVVGADVGYPPAVLVAHVEYLAVVLGVRVEPDRPLPAVEGERQVGEVLPPLRLQQTPLSA